MPVSKAVPGFGCVLAIGDGDSNQSFTDLAEILGVPGVGITHRSSEVTHMTSPGGWAEYIGLGVKEGKAFTLPLNFVADDAQQISLKDRVIDGSKNDYRVKFTDDGDSSLTFGAIITDLNLDHDRDSQAQASITFQPTGAHAWA